MPIGNIYLSEYQVGRVSFPFSLIDWSSAGSHIDTNELIYDAPVSTTGAPSLLALDVAFTKFDVKVDSRAQPVELIQGWPMAKILEVSAATYVNEIELPVILAPSSVSGVAFRIRTNEVAFWLAWLKYMMSTFDRASVGGMDSSVIVERASCRVTPDGISLGLRIVSNYPLDWTLILSTGNTIIGRQAVSHDTFVSVEDYLTGVSPTAYNGVGLNDRWGITSLSIDASTSQQQILTSRGGYLSAPSGSNYLIPDQLNAKMVSYAGTIDVFGLVHGWNLDYDHETSAQTDRMFRLGTASTDPGRSVFTDAMASGGLCVYVGSYDGGAGSMKGIPMLMLPSGTAVGTTGFKAGRGPVSISSEFSGVVTNAPWQSTGRPYSAL